MALQSIELDCESVAVPSEISAWIAQARRAVEAFEDAWDRRPIEQFVAADYELIYRALESIRAEALASGRRFCEWGCGFGVVATLAAGLGWDAIGIEAEPRLLKEGQKLCAGRIPAAELVLGNFLPEDAERLADDTTLPSLSHRIESVYDSLGLEIDDFALIYAYPWPGEEYFFEDVFERYAANGALLLLFCGAYDLRLYRKVRVS